MNQFIKAVKDLDIETVQALLEKDPRWLSWYEKDGKNALHYLCGLKIAEDPDQAEKSLQILKLLLDSGMDINAVQEIPDEGCSFFATPLWYAYTRGRNERLYTYILELGVAPEGCMYAIAWNDEVEAAELFKKHGATLDDASAGDTPFLAAIGWKRFRIAEWFLQNGADVNATDQDGNTALYAAVKKKYPTEMIELLLRYGAETDRENKAFYVTT